MKLNKLALLLLLPVMASHAATEQVPTDRTITSIHAYNDLLFINFSPNFQFNQGCTNSDDNWRVTFSTAKSGLLWSTK